MKKTQNCGLSLVQGSWPTLAHSLRSKNDTASQSPRRHKKPHEGRPFYRIPPAAATAVVRGTRRCVPPDATAAAAIPATGGSRREASSGARNRAEISGGTATAAAAVTAAGLFFRGLGRRAGWGPWLASADVCPSGDVPARAWEFAPPAKLPPLFSCRNTSVCPSSDALSEGVSTSVPLEGFLLLPPALASLLLTPAPLLLSWFPEASPLKFSRGVLTVALSMQLSSLGEPLVVLLFTALFVDPRASEKNASRLVPGGKSPAARLYRERKNRTWGEQQERGRGLSG